MAFESMNNRRESGPPGIPSFTVESAKKDLVQLGANLEARVKAMERDGDLDILLGEYEWSRGTSVLDDRLTDSEEFKQLEQKAANLGKKVELRVSGFSGGDLV